MPRGQGVVKLVVDGERFHSTHNTLEAAEETTQKMEKRGIYSAVVIKDFGVCVSVVDPKLHRAIEWDEGPGYSVWYSLRSFQEEVHES